MSDFRKTWTPEELLDLEYIHLGEGETLRTYLLDLGEDYAMSASPGLFLDSETESLRFENGLFIYEIDFLQEDE